MAIYLNLLKPFIDRASALIMTIFLCPFFLILYILVKLDSKGPFLYIQKRIGRAGTIFSIYKIRSMIHSAESQAQYYTEKNDRRITRLGRVIRKTSIDELPQMFNVLNGSMSLIGVRPDTPQQEKNYMAHEWIERHRLKPGITGLAQSTIRSSSTHRRRLKYDLFYVRNACFVLDIIIIYRTMKILFKKGVQN